VKEISIISESILNRLLGGIEKNGSIKVISTGGKSSGIRIVESGEQTINVSLTFVQCLVVFVIRDTVPDGVLVALREIDDDRDNDTGGPMIIIDDSEGDCDCELDIVCDGALVMELDFVGVFDFEFEFENLLAVSEYDAELDKLGRGKLCFGDFETDFVLDFVGEKLAIGSTALRETELDGISLADALIDGVLDCVLELDASFVGENDSLACAEFELDNEGVIVVLREGVFVELRVFVGVLDGDVDFESETLGDKVLDCEELIIIDVRLVWDGCAELELVRDLDIVLLGVGVREGLAELLNVGV
jgi:hypothetical protein